MLRKTIPILALFLVGCLQGPAGENGQDGANAQTYSFSGSLTTAARERWNSTGTALYSWDIYYSRISASKIVQVRVRESNDDLWMDPQSPLLGEAMVLVGEGYVRIIETDATNPLTGFSYRVVVAE